jgi:phospholipid/cholesterol/gamma-HCH transport system substrate-binding protein
MPRNSRAETRRGCPPLRADATLVVADRGGPPTLYADPSAGADVTQAAREVLSRIDGLVGENETALRSSLRNIETVTSTTPA